MFYLEIRGHLVSLQFYRDQIRPFKGPTRKKAIEFEVQAIDMPNRKGMCGRPKEIYD